MNKGFPPIMQNAFVVGDLEAALNYWTAVMNVGPFLLFEHVDYGGVIYRGQATDIDASVAMACWGDVQIELIEQHNDSPSVYRDFLRSGRSGMQHMATYSSEYDGVLERLERQGLRPVQTGGEGIGVRFCYFESDPTVGCLELIEATPAIQKWNLQLRALATKWDGTHPVRRISNVGSS